jgi:replicative DNA helicase
MDEKYLYYLNDLVKNMFHEQKVIPYIIEQIKLDYIPKEYNLQKSIMFAMGTLWKEQKTINKITIDTKAVSIFRGDDNELQMYLEMLETTKPELEETESIEYILQSYRKFRIENLSGRMHSISGMSDPNYQAIYELADMIQETIQITDDNDEPNIEDIIRSQPLIEFHNPDLRSLFRGVLRANLTFVAAEPGMGKTSLLVAWTQDFLDAGYNIMWFPNDGEYKELIQKLVSHRLQINSELLIEANYTEENPHGKLTEEEYEKVKQEIEFIRKEYIETGRLTVKDKVTTLAETKLFIRKEKPDIAIIDTIQGMDMPNDEPMASGIPIILKGLKKISKQMDCAIIGATWMDCAGNRPTVDKIYASKDMRRKAAKIWMLYYYYSVKRVSGFKNLLELIEGKSRHSKLTMTMLEFKPEYSQVKYPADIDKAVKKMYSDLTGLSRSK